MKSSFLDELEKEVATTEAATSAELVVVLTRRAERYPDVPWKAGALLAGVTFLLIVFLPIDFSPYWMILDVALAFGLGYLSGRASDPCRRLLTTRRRRRGAVLARAHQTFSERGVSLTRERTGVLWFYAAMEREAVLRWDVGIERCIPYSQLGLAARELERALRSSDMRAGFRKGFEILRPLLSQYLPPAPDNPNEIPNRPVVLP